MANFRVLGPIEVWAGERRMSLGGPRQLTLLAFLLLNAKLADVAPRGERERLLARARELLVGIGNHRDLSRIYTNAAYDSLLEDRPADSMAYSEIARAAAERVGDVTRMMFVMGNIGVAHLFRGEVGPADAAFRRQLELCRGQAFAFGADEGLAGVAAVAAAEGHPERAAKLLGAAATLGFPLPVDQPVYDRLDRDYLTPARMAYGPAQWDHAHQLGGALSYDAAIGIALESVVTRASPVDERGDATSVVSLGVSGRSGASSPSHR